MAHNNEPIRTGVIGYGLSAKIFHIPFLLALPSSFTLSAIVQRTPTAASSAPKDHPNVKHYTSLEGLLADTDIELVIITSIPSTHFDFAAEALAAGKHVLCEKPFVPTSAEALELDRLANKSDGCKLIVYQNRRWDADFLMLKRLVENGTLGRVVDVESHFDRHRPDPPSAVGGQVQSGSAGWKQKDLPGNGAVYDLGSHLLDQFVALWGMPDRVTAFVGNQREEGGDVADSFTIHLHYDKRGMLATARAGVVSLEEQQLRFWARGTQGTFRKYNLDIQEDQLKAGKRPSQDEDFGVENEKKDWNLVNLVKGDGETQGPSVQYCLPEGPPETYLGFYRHLWKAIRGGADVPVSASDAGKVLKLIELAKLSSDSGTTLQVAFP